MYIALKYIGGKYTPGEILPDNLPDDTLKWLLEAGAIRKTAPAPFVPADNEVTTPESTEPQKEPQTLDGDADTEEDDANDNENAASEEAGDEIDEEAEVPEIDVMDGLVPGDADVQKESDSKLPVKKPSGRRKAK